MTKRTVKFGDLAIGPLARRKIAEALDRNWVTEGPNVAEFEQRYGEKFGWTHCIATSSGTTAGEVAWAAVRELKGCQRTGERGRGNVPTTVLTSACAFVATANSILNAGMMPNFIDVNFDTLNMIPQKLGFELEYHYRNLHIERTLTGVQFVVTMGKPMPIVEIAKIAAEHDLYLVGDFCEAHGAQLIMKEMPIEASWVSDIEIYADHYCDAAIYSFYVAHMIVGGEGGMICTDDDEIAGLCRSIKSHGRPAGSNFFDFQRTGFNAKWNDLCAAVALESLGKFDETFARRREVRAKLIQALEPFEDRLILYRDAPGEIIAPHAFPVVLRDEATYANGMLLYRHLEENGIECKTLWGALTNHRAFQWMGIPQGTFPVAERIGRTGLHFGCSEFITDEDVDYIHGVFKDYFERI